MIARHGIIALALLALVSCARIEMQDITVPRPVPADSCVVVGFLGGRGRWDDDTREVRRLALRLREENAAQNLYVETFDNRSRDVAERFVVEALDRDGGGHVEADEAEASRVVVYGLSFGGAAVVKFARQLNELRIPVALTVQVDSVGIGDGRIPANVEQALNLYQDNGWLIGGEHPIRAEDPERTDVIGNLRYDYSRPPGSGISLDGLPWWALVFRVAHARMSRDPAVWTLVETAIGVGCEEGNLNEVIPSAR